jgi:predicted nucleic acid-binding protein
MIVSDAGPVIIFARIGRLSLLHDVTGSLLIPDAIYDEIEVNQGGMPGAADVAQAAWVQKASVANRSIIDGLPNILHERRA